MPASKENNPINSLIPRIEELLRKGRSLEAQKELNLLKKQKFNRETSLKIASLARRARDINYAFRLLDPYVKFENGLSIISRNDELLEYACLLTYIGALPESLAIFAKIKDKNLPDSYLFYIFALFRQWKYEEAIPLLKQYLKIEKLTDYQIAIAKVNLAAAYCFVGNFSEVEQIVFDLMPNLKNCNHHLLLGNCHEILGQSFIFRKLYPEARKFLNEAKAYLKDAPPIYLLFSEKWLAIVDLFEKENPNRLQLVRKKAIAIKHWETLRDCDLFEALATHSEKLFTYVYAGTPYKAYRQRMLRLWERSFKPPEKFEWIRFYDQIDQQQVLDLTSVSIPGTLKMDLPLKALRILASDFYDHFHVGTLFAKLHPDEHYNHQTSPHRIYDTLRRLRSYLSENNIPIAINNKELTYRLFFTGPCSLKIWIESISEIHNEEFAFLALLKKCFGKNNFKAKSVVDLTQLSIRTVQRKLKYLSDNAYIEKSGSKKSSCYRIT